MLKMFYFCIGEDVSTFIVESLYFDIEIEMLFILITTRGIKINKTSSSIDRKATRNIIWIQTHIHT